MRYAPAVSTPRAWWLLLSPWFAGASGCSGVGDGATAALPGPDAASVVDTAADLGAFDSAADAPPVVDAAADVAPSGSAGCGRAMTSGVTNRTLDVAGVSRSYVLSIPDGYDSKKPFPVVFAWHGRLGTGAQFRAYSGVETASAGKAIFVYPNGLPVTANPADTGWDLTAGGRDVALFDALLTDVSKNLCVDARRVFSFGHSYGAYLTNVLGCRRSKDLLAIAAFAGGPPTGSCDGPIAAWIAHARDDTVVPVAEGFATRDKWGGLDGCDLGTSTAVEPAPCVAYGSCNPKAPLVWCNPLVGNHNWPPFAAQGIWGFFASR